MKRMESSAVGRQPWTDSSWKTTGEMATSSHVEIETSAYSVTAIKVLGMGANNLRLLRALKNQCHLKCHES